MELHVIGTCGRIQPHLVFFLPLQGNAHLLAHLHLRVKHGVALVEAALELLAFYPLQLLADQAVLPTLMGLNNALDGWPKLPDRKWS